MKKIGVLLLNMGGPDSLESVQPFLYNLFSDHDIVQIPRIIQRPTAWLISHLRTRKTRHYYEVMGGKSPQREQTQEQARRLQELLGKDFKVSLALRYWHPFTEEALIKLFEDDIQNIVLLPMYPQYSKTTTGSSFREFDRVFKNFPQVPVIRISSYHNHTTYIRAMVENIKENIKDPEDYFFLFTAHSLPVSVIKSGDPYKKQTEETVSLIMEHFPNVKHTLGYQSKIGPVKWIEPFTDKLLRDLLKSGVKKIALIPVSFVCEHSETLYELDHLYASLAERMGVESFVRVPTLMDHPTFINALKELVLYAVDNFNKTFHGHGFTEIKTL